MKKLILILGGCAACAAGFALGVMQKCRRRTEDRRFVERGLEILEGEGGIVLE